ncbi:MAG TPA: PfkB family carbohydrate kinase [Devosia sp.]|nr:PfkB family carbohydrate kinase [Devosia sp.]
MFVVGGECLIDLVQEGVGPDGKIRMSALEGGSPYNCAIALAKLGKETGFLCPISKDGFGDYLLAPLDRAGVRPLLADRVAAPTTLAVVTFNERMQAQYEFYRGADRAYTATGLIAALPQNLDVLQFGGFTTIEPEDAASYLEVVKTAVGRGVTVTMDPNMRPSLVHDFAAYAAQLDRFFDLVHLVKVSIEDLVYFDTQRVVKDIDAELPAAEQEVIVTRHVGDLLKRPNCELVVVTYGEHGSRAFARGGATATAPIYSPPVFGDTVGAGDSLMAGILTFLGESGDLKPGRLGALDAETLQRMLRFGAVVAGLNCAHKGCNPPTRAEVDAVLAA